MPYIALEDKLKRTSRRGHVLRPCYSAQAGCVSNARRRLTEAEVDVFERNERICSSTSALELTVAGAAAPYHSHSSPAPLGRRGRALGRARRGELVGAHS
jgi:hypothetical protein